MFFAPVSIPSPAPEWRQILIPWGEWLHALIPAVDETLTLRITTYALVIMVGMVAAVLIANHRLSRRGAESWLIIDVGIWAVVLGIIGARFYHVITHPDDFFGEGKNTWDPTSPGSVWAIWEGGGAIFGSLIFGALGVWIGARLTGLRFWSVADALAPALLVAQAFGRLGNYVNQELFGLPTDALFGLEIDRPNGAIPNGIGDDVLFQPTFAYEIIWNLVGFALILFITQKYRSVDGRLVAEQKPFWQWGKTLGLYLIWYGVGRAWIESIRLDPSETFLGIRSNVWAALAAIVVGLLIIAIQTRRHTGAEPDVYEAGKRPVNTAGVHSEDTYSDSDEPGDGAAEVTEDVATSGATSPK